MTKISLHDNIVTGYTISCDRREVVIHTVFRDRLPNEKINVVFRGVEAYHLVGDNMQSILFDVAECPTDGILREFSSEFESGIHYAWPGPWNESPESCRKHFEDLNCKTWRISSSYGMGGFVIAMNVELKQDGGQQNTP
jgi:hypothetical protein